MSFRTLIIKNRSKLELSLGYLVYRTEKETRILLSEITTLIIQSTAVSLTSALISELSKRKIKVIFCDEKSNPESELVSYYGDTISSKRIKEQFEWKESTKKSVWSSIITQKVFRQKNVLEKYGFAEKAKQLENYMDEIVLGDETNREGHAAKVYFNTLFGANFTRSQDNNINAALNYGYSVILARINREIVASGYLTQLGINHINEFNHFNFACDLIEPYRPIVDDKVKKMVNDVFPENFKREMIDILNTSVTIQKMNTTLDNSIRIYVASVLSALNNDSVSDIDFYFSYEL